jgi:hypothetical protein
MLALASLLLLSPNLRLVGIAYIFLGVVAFIGLQRLHVPELLELRRAIARGLRRSSTIAQNVALREALDLMAGMESSAEALEELGRAFEQTDFLEAEIRLLGESDERDTDRVAWTWHRSRASLGLPLAARSQVIDLAAARDHRADVLQAAANAEEVSWEARLPLIDDATGTLEGWLTIRRPWGTYLPSELDVLAREVLPSALGRRRESDEAKPAKPADADVRAGGSRTAQQLRGGPSEVGA